MAMTTPISEPHIHVSVYYVPGYDGWAWELKQNNGSPERGLKNTWEQAMEDVITHLTQLKEALSGNQGS